ncbi:capsule assembly Wzi family protein [Parapedobacter koreensis]|uniref:Capsule assembly protein Wzi n=1 Tax=Parapedobacter koreensis TaxID=332977 RepID=A0A1H7NM28_9SPHI|nr:capsule assembly Wzi family protein [Parapedobacter koreensis]SEL24603.1 Capsule assembly protein Wzi [Parapedobacter koreensis]
MKNKLSLFLLLLPAVALSQQTDSLKFRVGTTASIASEGFQPLWIESNRFGLLSEKGQDIATYIGAWNTHTFSGGKHIFRLEYGANLVNNHHFDHLVIQQGYIKARYGALEFRGGRYEEILGEVDPLLSTGSLGISGNALPIPKVGFALPEYTPVPFTNGWLYAKGLISHGWMGNNQSMKQAWLHEKTLYLRLGKGPFKVYGGVQHFAVWGGQRAHFKLDRSLGGFFDVLFVKEANDGSVPDGILPNRAGDHRGLIEFGGDLETNNAVFHMYFQVPFESGMGIDIRNIDRLGGLNVTLKSHRWIDRLLFEFIYTKQMESFQDAELQSYYNNGVYANGWEYDFRSVGTPLFLNRYRGANFLPISPVYWRHDDDYIWGNQNFINNRIAGGHIGMLHRYTSGITGRTMLTYTRNFRTHGNFITASPKNQVYTLHEVAADLKGVPGLRVSAGVAFDTGGFYENVGGLFGIRYEINSQK